MQQGIPAVLAAVHQAVRVCHRWTVCARDVLFVKPQHSVCMFMGNRKLLADDRHVLHVGFYALKTVSKKK